MSILDNLFDTGISILKSGNGVTDWLNRGIVECGTVDTAAILENSFHLNTVFSGSNQQYRTSALVRAIPLSLSSKLPVIALHTSFSPLPTLIKQFSQQYQTAFINPNSMNYVPFDGINNDDAIDIIMDSIPEKYAVNPNARYYLEAITQILTANNKPTTFKSYLTCPHDTLFDRTDALETSGIITSNQAQGIKSKLMIGQSENYKLDSFLKSLAKQMGNALYSKNSRGPGVSIKQMVQRAGLIAFDIGVNCRSIYVDFIVEQIKNLSLRGARFMLIIDSMNIAENQKLKELVSTPLSGSTVMISCDDLIASCSGNKDLADAILGVAEQYFIFSHSSGASTEQWAALIGSYEKTEKSTSTQKGRTYDKYSSDPFSHPVNNDSRTVTVSKRRDYVVPPEKISGMQANEFYYKVKNTKGVKHCRVG